MILDILLILSFGIGDIYTTHRILQAGGREGNPIMRFLINTYGFNSFIAVKAFIIWYIILTSRDIEYYVPPIIIGTLLIIWNTYVISKLKLHVQTGLEQ